MRYWTFWMTLVICCQGAAGADVIELISGERLQGRIIEQTGATLVLDHSILGRLSIPAGAVRSTLPQDTPDDPQPAESPAPLETGAADAEPQDPPDEDPVSPHAATPTTDQRPWKSRVELGFGTSEGNTEDANLVIAVRTTYEKPEVVHRFDARYSLRTSRGDRSENRFTGGVLSEWPRPNPRWNYFGQARYDYDEFQSWDQRVTGGGGVGYHLVDINDDTAVDESEPAIDLLDLRVRAGVGVRREFGSMNEDLQPEGILGAEFAWRLTPRQQLAANSTYFPNLSDREDYRIVTNAEWVLDVDTLSGLSIKLGFAHEFQSITNPGVHENDVSLYGAIVLDF